MDATQAKDKVCKRLFRRRRLVEDLLRGHVSGRWVRHVDFGTLRPMPTEFINRAGDRRFGDALWLASLRDGRQVMVMIEIQSGVDRDMAARMTAYTGMVYESLAPASRGAQDGYPAIFPLVVYTGNADWTAPDSLRDVAAPVPGLAVYVAGRRYTRLDLGRLPRDDLSNNRFSVLARLTGSRSPSDMVPVLSKATGWLRRDGEDEEDRKLLAAYQDWVRVLLPQFGMPVTDPDTDVLLSWGELMDGLTTLEVRSREWPQEWLEQGREEGREQGRVEGRVEGQLTLLSRQVSRRFGAATAEALVAALKGGGDPVRLEAVADLVLDCETGPELLSHVNGKPGP